jgi:NADH dehydrogenase FAD-containing subunit
MAAELKMLEPQQKVTLIHSRSRLLSSEPLPDEVAKRVCSILQEEGVEVILGQRVIDTTAVDAEAGQRMWRLTLGDGQQIMTGHVLSAISRCVPTSTYLPAQTLDKEGYVKVHSS